MTIMKLTARTPKRVTAFMKATLVLDAARQGEDLDADAMKKERGLRSRG
jgi:hypothetical protein